MQKRKLIKLFAIFMGLLVLTQVVSYSVFGTDYTDILELEETGTISEVDPGDVEIETENTFTTERSPVTDDLVSDLDEQTEFISDESTNSESESAEEILSTSVDLATESAIVDNHPEIDSKEEEEDGAKTISAIYLNGVSGDDASTGETLETAVKTFSRIMELLDLNQSITTVYISGTTPIVGEISL